ncbi:MAG: sigma-70 family RNA polymerase sigma factor [Planctomycetes bacterium]|nr:sigma-70 family RNA polymerase sigma factor [Planctomycetota bacterium]
MDFDRIVEQFRGPLTGLIASWGASPADAIELCMDAFSEGYMARDRFRGDWDEPREVGAWLRGIAQNLHRAHRRKLRRSPTLLTDADRSDLEADRPAGLSPRAERVRRAMGLLRQEHREVLSMRYVENSGLAEIAALIGTTERAVEGRLYRARKALSELLLAGESASDGAVVQGKSEVDNG